MDETQIIVALVGIFGSLGVALLTFLVNERSKRKTALNEKIWDIKFESLYEIMYCLWDLGRLAYYMCQIQLPSAEDREGDEFDTLLMRMVVVWADLHRNYFPDERVLKSLNRDIEKEIDWVYVRGVSDEIIEYLKSLSLTIEYETHKAISKLELIIEDESVIEEAYDLIERVIELPGRLSEEYIDVDAETETIQDNMQRFTAKSRTELESTRTAKFSY